MINEVSPGPQVNSNLMQTAFNILHVKNGTQQTRKQPDKREKKLMYNMYLE